MANKLALTQLLQPERVEDIKKAAQALMTSQSEAYARANAGQDGITKESWHLQTLPDGTTALVAYLESPDVVRTMLNYSISQNPFELWYNTQLRDSSSGPTQSAAEPLSRLLLDWFMVDRNSQHAAIVLPIQSDKTVQLQELAQTLKNQRLTDFSASQARIGVTKMSWHHQTGSSDTGHLIIYIEGAKPWDSLKAFAHSQQAFDLWLKAELFEITRFDLSQSSPYSQVIFDSPQP